jgi:histidinol-phosphatase (PHP family)
MFRFKPYICATEIWFYDTIFMQSLTSPLVMNQGDNMFTDCHNHTSQFSGDASMTAAELFTAAKKAHLDAVVITEHYEMDYPHPMEKEQIFDVDAFFAAFSQWKALVPEGLSVFSGIELGYQPPLTETYNRLTSQYPFDSIILSNHLYTGKDPYFFPECYLEPKEILYSRYLNELTDMVLSGTDFDIVGHFDYMARYAPYKDPRLFYADVPDAMDRFLLALVKTKKSLEINTRSISKYLKKGFADGWPDRNILKKYLELGGERVSLGSDSHDISTVGNLFVETAAYLRECGFRELTSYVGRKEIRTPIL